MQASRMAASSTDRVIGPGVSWLMEIGMMWVRDRRPTVGFRPTIPQRLAGETIEPSVSVPTAPPARLAAIAAALPELEPEALRSSTCGLRVNPPMADQPLTECTLRMLAHSLKFVLP